MADALARSGAVSGPYRLEQGAVKALRRAIRRGLALAKIYDDDIDWIAEIVVREIRAELEADPDGQKRNAAS